MFSANWFKKWMKPTLTPEFIWYHGNRDGLLRAYASGEILKDELMSFTHSGGHTIILNGLSSSFRTRTSKFFPQCALGVILFVF